jgi:hypothetical protein
MHQVPEVKAVAGGAGEAATRRPSGGEVAARPATCTSANRGPSISHRPAQWKSYGIRIGRDEDATLLAAAPGVLTGFRETGLSEPKAKQPRSCCIGESRQPLILAVGGEGGGP